MNMRRWVPILIGIVLIAFGVGIFSLIYNDNFSMTKIGTGNFIKVTDKDEMVKVGPGGIEVRDGDSHVSISWRGIQVWDGSDNVDIGWNGIRVNEDGKSRVNIGGKLPWFTNKDVDLHRENINVEEFLNIDGVDNINISSPFVDIKITETDREDLRVHYYGSMRTNVIPKYKFEKKSGGIIDIKIEVDSITGYVVRDSDMILEVFIPKVYKGNINTSTTSSDIYMKDIDAGKFSITSTSGNLELENIQGEIYNINTTSGHIELEDLIGEILISTTSGDISLDIDNGSDNMEFNTVSGNIELQLGKEASYIIDGKTTSGDFISKMDMNIKENSRNTFKATIGSGDNSIKLHTVSESGT